MNAYCNRTTQNHNRKSLVYYEIFITILALVAVVTTVLDKMEKLNDMILIIFAIDYIGRLIVSENKLKFIKSNVLDLIAIIPFNSLFRAFRVVKLLKLVKIIKITKATKLLRILNYTKKFHKNTKKFLNTNGFKYMIYITIAIVFVGSIVIYAVEKGDIIKTYNDAVWLSFTSVTLFGYEGVEQMSMAGKIICGVLALIGVIFTGSFTATLIKYIDEKKNNNSNGNDEEKVTSIDISTLSQDEQKEVIEYIEYIRFKKSI
ncbi:ion transporter [Abyssisolibacter fermentans]|uniref:ion transporter n=1 Tax=Abyssisolibacter fermentans TaxID=1766203 RepID=UPI0008376A5B|nr:potassium channel family protein [Abyssisolibacter fermentans]